MPSSKQKAIQRNRDNAAAKKTLTKKNDLKAIGDAIMNPTPVEEQAEPTPVATPDITAKTRVRGGPSIRKLINGMLIENKSTEEISEALQLHFPGTKAAEKSNKHISYYRSKMRKEQPGVIPEAGSKADEPATIVVAKKAKKAAAE